MNLKYFKKDLKNNIDYNALLDNPYTTKNTLHEAIKARLVRLGKINGFKAFPECNPEKIDARTDSGRIDVIWFDKDYKPVYGFEIDGACSKRSIRKLNSLKDSFNEAEKVIIAKGFTKSRIEKCKSEIPSDFTYLDLEIYDKR